MPKPKPKLRPIPLPILSLGNTGVVRCEDPKTIPAGVLYRQIASVSKPVYNTTIHFSSRNFNIEELNRYNIKNIIGLTMRPLENPCIDRPYYGFIVEDGDDKQLQYLYNTSIKNILDRIVIEGPVLIHCDGGHSRSQAIVAKYIMDTYHISFEQVASELEKADAKDDSRQYGIALPFLLWLDPSV